MQKSSLFSECVYMTACSKELYSKVIALLLCARPSSQVWALKADQNVVDSTLYVGGLLYLVCACMCVYVLWWGGPWYTPFQPNARTSALIGGVGVWCVVGTWNTLYSKSLCKIQLNLLHFQLLGIPFANVFTQYAQMIRMLLCLPVIIMHCLTPTG